RVRRRRRIHRRDVAETGRPLVESRGPGAGGGAREGLRAAQGAVIPALVVLGNLLVDDMVFPDGRTRMAEPGGATLYAALGASLWGLAAGVASVRGDDYPASALDALTARGVDLSGVRPLGGPGLRT